MDEPIFLTEDTSEHLTAFDAPSAWKYLGSRPEGEIPASLPKIYFDYEVGKTLQREGQRSIREDREVAGILLGTKSPDDRIIKVSHIAIARDEDSSPVHFKFTYSVWDDLIDQMERMSQDAGQELLLLGWYHTHPNMAVFLSRYDLRTHRDFSRPYQFALVLAPKLGTTQTAVGFFVNREGGTPLLPGVRLFGLDTREDVATTLPWRFQEVEAEGIEEGEGDEKEKTGDQEPVLHQLGVVRMEDPDWLTLGVDPSEGAVLPILEGMAASVVKTKQDRYGVLLGTKTADNHVTIHRVRFLGTMREDAAGEREDLLIALRFMAETFPAKDEQKILGVVRIVSPHRFSAGDTYDPVEHNIRIALLLKEVGYDLDQVPFQVGLVLYAGIEPDVLFFQVFAQNKTSRPVPLMSMQAMAPPAMRANERYESVDGALFRIEATPCMQAPTFGEKRLTQTQAPKVIRPAEAEPDATGDDSSTGRWNAAEAAQAEPGKRGSIAMIAVLAGVVVAGIVGVIVLRGNGDPAPAPTGSEGAGTEVVLGQPYEYQLVGCGANWNPGLVCAPLPPDLKAGQAPLLRVRMLPAYSAATVEPLDVWLLPENLQDRPRVRLERGGGEGDSFVYSVAVGEQRWDDFWGDGEPFGVKVVLAPRGAELDGGDELAALRRSEDIRLVGRGAPAAGTPDALPPSDGPGKPPVPTVGAAWTWRSGGGRANGSFDLQKNTFGEPLLVEGGASADGEWTFDLREQRGGVVAVTTTARDLRAKRGTAVDVTRQVTELLRSARAGTLLQKASAKQMALWVSVTPPGGLELLLEVRPQGEARAGPPEHRVCIMIKTASGAYVEGQATVDFGEMRSTWMSDGSNSADCYKRWPALPFGQPKAKLRFVELGGPPEMAAMRNKPVEMFLDGRFSTMRPACVAITVNVDEHGVQSEAPSVRAVGDPSDGSCP